MSIFEGYGSISIAVDSVTVIAVLPISSAVVGS